MDLGIGPWEIGKPGEQKMSENIEEYRARVIATGDERGEFFTDVDGFVYWWPESSTKGHLSSYHLRWLADELDKRNQRYLQEMEKFHATTDLKCKKIIDAIGMQE